MSRVAQDGDRVGQVVLALRVLRAQSAQRGCEEPTPEAIDRGVDLVDLALFGGRVGVFHDGGDAPVLTAHDATEAIRLRDRCGEDRGRRVLQAVLGGETRDRLGAHERRVTRQNEDVVLGIEIVEDRERHADRVAGSTLHALLDELDRHFGDELVVQRLGHALGRVPDDHHDPFERKLGKRVDDVQHHRSTTQWMQDLRCPRAHPRAFSRGKDHCAQGSVLPHTTSLLPRAARGRGFEPRLRTPKDLVLPLHHPRNVFDVSGRCGAVSRLLVASTFVMGSLIKKRRKRMRKKKHKKLLKKTRWQRRQQGK